MPSKYPMNVLLSFLGIFILSVNIHAQENIIGIGSGSWGIFGDIHSNQHISDFSRLPSIPNCCPTFQNGMNEQFAGTIGFHIPLSHSFILRPSLTMWDGTLRYSEFTKGGIGGQIVDVEIGHSIESSIRSAGLEALYVQNLFSTFQAGIGCRVDYVYQSSYSQQEELLQPSNMGNWNNGSTIRNANSGDIPESSNIAIAPILSLHWTFPANKAKTILISPEFMATYNLIPIINNYDWNVLALRFGCAVTFMKNNIVDTSRNEIIIPVKETITEKKIIPCEVSMQGKDSDGNTMAIDSIIIKETSINKLQPLLPFVFFEEGESIIPSRYSKTKIPEHFTIDELAENTKLEIYSSILDIIGQRLRNKSNAQMILTGCNANHGIEKNNKELSRKRAETVRTYLHETWGIALDRLKVIARNMPANPSITRTGEEQDIKDSRQENRRVELFSDDPSILEPVHINKTMTMIEPEKVQLVFPEITENNDPHIQLIVKVNDSVILHKNFTSKESIMTIDPSALSSIMKNNEAANYEIMIKGSSLQGECSASLLIPITKSMKIEKQKLDSSYSEYSLMLFPFNSSGLGEHNMAIIEMIKQSLLPGAKIMIEGFTDRVGTSSYNKKLSFNRAKSVFNALQLETNKYSIVPDTDILGSGEQDVHVLPEGRLYWRTVNIYVKNPMVKP